MSTTSLTSQASEEPESPSAVDSPSSTNGEESPFRFSPDSPSSSNGEQVHFRFSRTYSSVSSFNMVAIIMLTWLHSAELIKHGLGRLMPACTHEVVETGHDSPHYVMILLI